MATISIEINDAKVSLIVEAVRWRYNNPALTPAECLVLVDSYLTNKLKTLVKDYQKSEYAADFVFDDPTV